MFFDETPEVAIMFGLFPVVGRLFPSLLEEVVIRAKVFQIAQHAFPFSASSPGRSVISVSNQKRLVTSLAQKLLEGETLQNLSVIVA